jgi:hypothetical protein
MLHLVEKAIAFAGGNVQIIVVSYIALFLTSIP